VPPSSPFLAPEHYRDLVRRALEEDIGPGDVTTEATVPAGQAARGLFIAKAECVVAGLDVAAEVFRQLEASATLTVQRGDGSWCRAGDAIAGIDGSARALLAGERTALNFLQRMSGIATAARRCVDAAAGRTVVLDTRKTTPTLRALEKYAVAAGGATNHRRGLFDAMLVKDNHVRLAGGGGAAVARARAYRPDLVLEVEAQSLAEVQDALDAGADIVLVDNLTLAETAEAVRRAKGRARVEISGGVTLERLPALAALGADFVSVGALTHSAAAADISFEMEPVQPALA
jgi:nicotinate-nucleotide pyrophosphorylase (carboxylating)